MNDASAQVHFHEDNTASCAVSVGSSGDQAVADTLLLWACLSVRHLNNMGKDAPGLATLLANMKGALEDLADHDGEGPRLLEACPGTAKRRFEAHLAPVGEGFTFKLHMKGFGIFGKGLGYYCPCSVLLFLRHLAKAHRTVPGYIECLEELAAMTGVAFLEGRVNMMNANQLACMHVAAVLPIVCPSLHQ